MAIDSAFRRQSSMRQARMSLIPDATISTADRVAMLGRYGGLYEGGGETPPPQAHRARVSFGMSGGVGQGKWFVGVNWRGMAPWRFAWNWLTSRRWRNWRNGLRRLLLARPTAARTAISG